MMMPSLKFIIFLSGTCLIYNLISKRRRNIFLLAASYLFYASLQPAFTLLLIAGTTVSFCCARFADVSNTHRRKLFTALGLAFMFASLFIFKYLGFFCSAVLQLVGSDKSFVSGLILPVGISFYTFSAASYLFDVYSGKIQSEKSFIDYALFISFFPSILSGPINRAAELLPQIKSTPSFSYLRMKRGLLRFFIGAVKKLVLADILGLFVNGVYANAGAPSAFILLCAASAYSLQIYFDFAGYTDMALGSAEILGFDLRENFRAPYLTRSVKDFWRRWHITLTSWLRDYLYFPLGGSRISKARTYFNILTVFAVSGLWHGASFTFIIWGLLNGAYQVIGQMLDSLSPRLRHALHIPDTSKFLAFIQCAVTFFLITIAWVFFRVDTLSDALYIIKSILLIPFNGFGSLNLLDYIGLRKLMMSIMLVAAFSLDDLCLVRKGHRIYSRLEERTLSYWMLLSLLVAFTIIFGVYGSGFDAQNFVYFQF